MNLPIPTHLQKFFTPAGEDNKEYEATGSIHCSCGNEQFEVWTSNENQLVKLICKQCGQDIIIFDRGKHGWNGFVCKDDYLDRTLPFEKYKCPECNSDIFLVNVCISSQGKEDFIEECVSCDDSFSPDDWVDGFESISISVSCVKCPYENIDWIDAETM